MSDFKRKKITEKKLGDILKAAREKKGLTLDQAEEETKVRAKYLESLENESFDILPGNVYTLGFLGKYLDFLDLPKKELIARFKIERGESLRTGRFMLTKKDYDPKFTITPKFLMIFAGLLSFILIIGYIVYSVRVFTQPPNLEISEPKTEQIIKEENVKIIGKTDSSATLMINGQSVLLDGNGNFSQMVKLNPGLNTFEIISQNRLKKQTTREVKILAQF